MALARNRVRVLAAAMLCCVVAALVLSAPAGAEERHGLLEQTTAGIQRTVTAVAAAPTQAVDAAGSAVTAATAVPPSVPDAVSKAGAQAGTLIAGAGAAASDVVTPVTRVAGQVVHAVPVPAPVTHVLQPDAAPVEESGAEAPRTAAGVTGRPPASAPASSAGTPGRATGGRAPSGPDTQLEASRGALVAASALATARPVSEAVPVPSRLAGAAARLGTPLLAGAPAPMTPSQAAPLGTHAGAVALPRGPHQTRSPFGQGTAVAQALAGASGGAATAIVLICLLLAWLACAARRLRVPADHVRDVRPLLILERPG